MEVKGRTNNAMSINLLEWWPLTAQVKLCKNSPLVGNDSVCTGFVVKTDIHLFIYFYITIENFTIWSVSKVATLLEGIAFQFWKSPDCLNPYSYHCGIIYN